MEFKTYNKLLNHQLHLYMETLRIKYGFNVKDLQLKFCSQESISSRPDNIGKNMIT